jgi:hypothetical protein
MKKINTCLLVALLMLVNITVFATDWGKPDKGYFTGQTGIDATEPGFTKGLATICFNGQLWNFADYQNGANSQIALRKLNNISGDAGSVIWKQQSKTWPKPFTGLGMYDWQPAPVVFNNILYLFVGNSSRGISWSAYNAGDSSWSKLTAIPGDFSGVSPKKLGYGMAAVVVGNRLCLVAQNYWGYIEIFTTADTTLANWTYYQGSDREGDPHQTVTFNMTGESDATYCGLSAISKTYMSNGRLKARLNYAYIDKNKHPRSIECTFDDNGNYILHSDKTISTERTYESVALAEGTVTGDITSTGKCVQAFLKLDKKDNGYCRYRIQRYQSQNNGEFTKQENNLVKQNYLWAREYTELTAVIFSEAQDKDIRQFMCLIYSGYNDWDWPLNCASVETDRLVFDPTRNKTQTIAGPSNTQYIGYIEGPPPYYLNNQPLDDPYLNPNAEDISDVEFSTSSGTSSSTDISYEVGGKVKFHAGFFKAGLNAAFSQAWGTEYSKTISNSIDVFASEADSGIYLTYAPNINRAFYKVIDVNGNLIDSTYNYYMTEPEYNLENAGLKSGLVPGDPKTYFSRPGINFASYSTTSYGNANVPWIGSVKSSVAIKIDQSESQSNTISAKLSLNAKLGEMFDVGFDGSFEYSMTTTTSTGNEVSCSTRLNKAVQPTDVTKLNYTMYWIKPGTAAGMNNWWLHEGATAQNTWCVTYDVTYVQHKNGKSNGSKKSPDSNTIEEESVVSDLPSNSGNAIIENKPPTSFALLQNSPNPCNSTTKIRYQIGMDNSQSGANIQANISKLVVYNLSGKEVAALVNEIKTPGSYEVSWDASNLSPGVYFYSLQSGSFKDVKKLIILK